MRDALVHQPLQLTVNTARVLVTGGPSAVRRITADGGFQLGQSQPLRA